MPTDGPRKIPKQARAKETVKTMYEALLRLMTEDELDPSVATIAERAGVSVGSVYQYFPTKRALVSRLLAYYVEKRATQLERDLESASGLGGREAAALLVDAVLGVGRRRVALDRAVATYVLRNGDVTALLALDARMVAEIARFLGGLRGDLRDTDLHMAAFVIFNALRSTVPIALMQHPEWLSDPTFRGELVALVVGYLERR